MLADQQDDEVQWKQWAGSLRDGRTALARAENVTGSEKCPEMSANCRSGGWEYSGDAFVNIHINPFEERPISSFFFFGSVLAMVR
jgi:hypothetical protein